MTVNKWTVALAAAGVVSVASVVRAEEATTSVLTALTPTTLSGYVDASGNWNFNTGNAYSPMYRFGGADKADGFNLNVVQLRIDKPLDDENWSAGYRVDLWAGPDANTLGTQSFWSSSSDFAIRQAYVALRMPVGNGIDLKMGVFDSIIGYESIEGPANPNFTRSYGHTIEPTTHTGLLASYRFCELFSASVGVANTTDPVINSRAQNGSQGWISGPFTPLWKNLGITPTQGDNAKAESYKAYMGSVALTAPESMGFLAGSTLYGGLVNGYSGSVMGSGLGQNQLNYYLGATINTPVTGLRAGVAFDYLDPQNIQYNGDTVDSHAYSFAGYLSFQATEKLSFHGRLEYFKGKLELEEAAQISRAEILAMTITTQYDLWKNVLSRLELRWDHSLTADKYFGGQTIEDGPSMQNAWMLAANIVYKF